MATRAQPVRHTARRLVTLDGPASRTWASLAVTGPSPISAALKRKAKAAASAAAAAQGYSHDSEEMTSAPGKALAKVKDDDRDDSGYDEPKPKIERGDLELSYPNL
ncbi:hypothetical protein GGR56DRAFT_678211 [Xylariaceae sp. FL0804]|nr:hypothetical protein GGR56DRAFT_678211 [Xylariaceae sp. FL0804]